VAGGSDGEPALGLLLMLDDTDGEVDGELLILLLMLELGDDETDDEAELLGLVDGPIRAKASSDTCANDKSGSGFRMNIVSICAPGRFSGPALALLETELETDDEAELLGLLDGDDEVELDAEDEIDVDGDTELEIEDDAELDGEDETELATSSNATSSAIGAVVVQPVDVQVSAVSVAIRVCTCVVMAAASFWLRRSCCSA
jgi:hypothetical protein